MGKRRDGMLSSKQQRILDFIRSFLTDNTYPPTIRDIVGGCGISSTSVADYNLGILEKAGFIRRHREVSRGIELLNDNPMRHPGLAIPLIGQIAAGIPIPVPAAETWDNVSSAETIEIPQELVRGKKDVYALKVKGLSMIDALINDGDIVLMQQTNTVENGEMAAVWLKNEKTVTLKKVYVTPDRVRLQPANSQMKPIFLAPDNVEIQGKVVAVIRQLT
jgi:repressor LexA